MGAYGVRPADRVWCQPDRVREQTRLCWRRVNSIFRTTEQIMDFKAIGNPTYIALETFRKSGEGVITPVWVVAEGDKLYVWTVGDSGKVKRIRNNGRVRIAVSDSRGAPKSDWVEAKAHVLDTPADEEQQRQRLAEQVWLAVPHVQFHESVFAQQGVTCGVGDWPCSIRSAVAGFRVPGKAWNSEIDGAAQAFSVTLLQCYPGRCPTHAVWPPAIRHAGVPARRAGVPASGAPARLSGAPAR